MEIKSINAINNQKFGMAKFANPQTIVKLTQKMQRKDALALIHAVPKSGCKNTSIVDIATNSSFYGYPIDHITIAFPKHSYTLDVHAANCGEDFTSRIVEGEKALAEHILYKEAQKGNLEKTKAGLIEDLPELQNYILEYSNSTPALSEINENALKIAKAREAYKKAHPILSIFHIPKNIS